jgi:polar amino acid transport system substrate-binding protein
MNIALVIAAFGYKRHSGIRMNETTIGGGRPSRREPASGGHGVRLLILVATLLLPAPAMPAAAPDPVTAPFVMGTDAEETTVTGKWYRRIYGEAFRRLGIPLSFLVSPTARLSTMADEGQVHGQATRVAAYAEAHPNQLRVDEFAHLVRLALYAFDREAGTRYPKRLEDLATGNWLVEYRRGVAICEKMLKPLLPAEKLSDITSTAQGMLKLKSGRTDLYCEFDLSIQFELMTPEFRGVSGFRPVLDLGVMLQMYPYVHKSRAELAPKLAETLKKMKAEGLIERYLRESQRELEAAH